jgi:hypothetical protein
MYMVSIVLGMVSPAVVEPLEHRKAVKNCSCLVPNGFWPKCDMHLVKILGVCVSVYVCA